MYYVICILSIDPYTKCLFIKIISIYIQYFAVSFQYGKQNDYSFL